MSGLFDNDARGCGSHALLVRSCAFAVLAMVCVLSGAAEAHGVIGDRFFPATISSDDPFAADELALPTISVFNHETDYEFDYSKSILPGIASQVLNQAGTGGSVFDNDEVCLPTRGELDYPGGHLPDRPVSSHHIEQMQAHVVLAGDYDDRVGRSAGLAWRRDRR